MRTASCATVSQTKFMIKTIKQTLMIAFSAAANRLRIFNHVLAYFTVSVMLTSNMMT